MNMFRAVILLGLLLPPAAVPAETNRWQPTAGPVCPEFTAIATTAADSSLVFASSTNGGLWQSTDHGATWIYLDPGDGSGNAASQVSLDPANPAVVYLAKESCILKSQDGGQSWQWLLRQVDQPAFDSPVYCFAVHPEDPGVIWAGFSKDGAGKTTDGGRTWSPANAGLPAGLWVTTLAIDPGDPDRLSLGSWEHGLFSSVDGGGQWAAAGSWGGQSVYSIAVDPHQPGHYFAGADQGIYRSTDTGDTWTLIAGSPTMAEEICLAPSAPDRLLCGNLDGAWLSTDGGSNWDLILEDKVSGEPRISVVAFDPLDEERLFAAGGVIHQSDDGGQEWAETMAGIRGASVHTLAKAPGRAGELFAGTNTGVFKSTDSGATWSRSLSALILYTLEQDPAVFGRLYAGVALNFFKTTDGGETWRSIHASSLGSKVRAVAIDLSNSDKLLAGAARGIFRSTDGGANWRRTGREGHDIGILLRHPAKPSVIFGADYRGEAFMTIDGGTTWTPLGGGLPPGLKTACLAIRPAAPFHLYLGTLGAGLFKSTDEGSHWQQLGTDPAESFYHVATDPAEAGVVYAVIGNGGLFRSDDGGESWLPMNSGFSAMPGALAYEGTWNHLLVDSAAPATLYGGADGCYVLQFLRGDVAGDGGVTPADLQLLKAHFAGSVATLPTVPAARDLDANHVVNLVDAVLLHRQCAK